MRILIVEDEARIANYLEKLTREILAGQLTGIHICRNLKYATQYLQKHAIDLLLLDLNLEGRDGFELLKQMVAGSFHTIIVSAYKDKAIKAFEYGVLDFVPKPFKKSRLEQAYSRYSEYTKKATYPAKYLAIKTRGRIRLVSVDDIIYMKGARAYSEIHLSDGTIEIHDKSLNKLNAILPEGFVRIHKSYIVKMDEVKTISVHSGSRYEAVLNNGITLPIGRTRYKQLKEKWI